MNQASLAKTTTPGVSDETLARLEKVGLDTKAQQRFHDIVTYSGATPDAILLFVEKGTSLQTIDAAVEARKDSAAASVSPLEQVVALARSIGDMTGEQQGLPEGMTIFNGKLVTRKEMADLELAMLQGEATAAGFDLTKTAEKAEKALPGSEGQASTDPVMTTQAKAPALESNARISAHSTLTPQQQVMNGLLEAAEEVLSGVEGLDTVETLCHFIDDVYGGDGLKAFVAMNRDEVAFNRALAGSVHHTSVDLLLEADEMPDDDGEDGGTEYVPSSLEAHAESESDPEEEF
jgi:hypothetical protein